MTTEKVSESTELLTKAFSSFHEKIFVPRNLDDNGKFQELANPIILALNTVQDFGCSYDESIVFVLDCIKDKCKGDQFLEKEFSMIYTDILKLTISANRFAFTYGCIALELQKSLDESYSL